MKYDFNKHVDRHGTNCEKWDDIATLFPNARKDALALWVADMDFACAPAITKALHERIDKEIFGYTISNNEEYKDVVQNWFARRFDWHIDKADMFYSPGVVPALSYLIQILSKPKDGIIIQEPVYHPFARTIRNHERQVVRNTLLNKKGNYEIDFDLLEEQFKDEQTVGMILCSPHNPVGRVWRKEELNKIVDLAKAYGKWIISDEIHCDIVRKTHRHIPLAKLRPDYADFIITCTAPSKSFNLAGLQNSNIMIHNTMYKQKWKKEIMDKLCIHEPNGFAQLSCIAAYRDSEDWLNQVNAYIDDNIAYVQEVFTKELPKAIVSPCEGTYLLWVDLRRYYEDYESLEMAMQKEAGVVFDEGYIFGESGKGFERINCACPRDILEETMKRMIQVIGKV